MGPRFLVLAVWCLQQVLTGICCVVLILGWMILKSNLTKDAKAQSCKTSRQNLKEEKAQRHNAPKLQKHKDAHFKEEIAIRAVAIRTVAIRADTK